MNEDEIIKYLQLLVAKIVEEAGSGHPGSAISLTPFYFTLTKYLRYDPDDALWADRDIVILSNGHTCLIYYIMLHLMRFNSANNKITHDDLISYRMTHSLTPGHPEITTPGVEACTGPLGQGLANSNGFALSQEKVKSSGVTFCIFGDGCYQEGISHEAFALASMYSKCTIFVYDCNEVTIDGPVKLSMNESQIKRFEAYGFYVVEIAQHDLESLNSILKIKINYLRHRHDTENKIDEKSGLFDIVELCSDKLLMIVLRTKIASGTVLEGEAKAHGAPLGKWAISQMEKKYGMSIPDLEINEEIYKYFEKLNETKREERKLWNKRMEKMSREIREKKIKPEDCPFFCYDLDFDWLSSKKYHYRIDKGNLTKIMDSFFNPPDYNAISTRKAFHQILEVLDEHIPFLLSGSADLTPSCLTKLGTSVDVTKPSLLGKYIRYGIREHGMFGMMTGLSSHGFFLPLGSTFLNFVTYGWHGIRLACLARKRVIYIATHDSICLGEDGPTHQPIETLALLRATPEMRTFRPCDPKELFGCFLYALEHDGPSLFALSRQDIDNCDKMCKSSADFSQYKNSEITGTSTELCLKGAYYIVKTDSDIVLYATGAEVPLALSVAFGIGASLVSFPCFELFELNTAKYKAEILPDRKFKVSVEALSSFGWRKHVDYCIAIDKFGICGRWDQVYSWFGFDSCEIKERIQIEYEKWRNSKK